MGLVHRRAGLPGARRASDLSAAERPDEKGFSKVRHHLVRLFSNPREGEAG